MRLAAALFAVFGLLWSAIPAAAHDSATGVPDVSIVIGSSVGDRDVRVGTGDIVRFVNRDGERHRMRSRSGPIEFDTGNLEPGESYQVRFSVPGTYAYVDERDRDDTRYQGRIVVDGAGATGTASGGIAGTGGSARTGDSAGTGDAVTNATVTIGDRVFSPGSTTVAVGGTVTFRNDDGDEHTATSTDGGGIDSGTLATGAAYRATFAEAGTFAFLCAFHPDMRGTIRVVSAAGAGAPAPAAPVPTATPVPVPADRPSAPGQVAPAAGPVRVDAADFAFRPSTIEVAVGGTVDWTNAGAAPHTVTAVDGSFESGMLAAGGTYTRTFETPGTFAYLCQFHPEMTATVEVVAGIGTGPAAVGAPPAAASVGAEPPAAGAGTASDAAIDTAAAALSASDAASGTSVSASNASDQGSLLGIVLSVTLVSVAVALFARLVNGAVHPAG